MDLFISQKAEKKYGKLDDTSQIDVSKISGARQSDGSSDEESGDKEIEDRRDLGPTSEDEEDTAEQDDLLVLKKRHVDFEPSPLPNEVDYKADNLFKTVYSVRWALRKHEKQSKKFLVHGLFSA